ncbi:unnamed protein product [Urochloa humidicola]
MPSIKLLATLGTNPLCLTRSSYPVLDLPLAGTTFADLAALVVGTMATLPSSWWLAIPSPRAPSSSFGVHAFVELRWPAGEATAWPPERKKMRSVIAADCAGASPWETRKVTNDDDDPSLVSSLSSDQPNKHLQRCSGKGEKK